MKIDIIKYKLALLNFCQSLKRNLIIYIFSGLLGTILGSGIYYWSHITFGVMAKVNIYYKSIEQMELVNKNLHESNFFLAPNLISCNSGVAERSENIQFDGLTKSALSGLKIFQDNSKFTTRLEYRAKNKFDAESCLSQIIKNLESYDTAYVYNLTENFYIGRASLLNSIKEYKYFYNIIVNKLTSYSTNKINNYEYAITVVAYSSIAAGLDEIRAKVNSLNNKIDFLGQKYMVISPIELNSNHELKKFFFPLLGFFIGIFTCFQIFKKH